MIGSTLDRIMDRALRRSIRIIHDSEVSRTEPEVDWESMFKWQLIRAVLDDFGREHDRQLARFPYNHEVAIVLEEILGVIADWENRLPRIKADEFRPQDAP